MKTLCLAAFKSMAVGLIIFVTTGAAGAQGSAGTTAVLRERYKLALALVRHTPTYSPPVAVAALAYLGITAFEVVASGDAGLRSLAGQLNGLRETPRREAGLTYDEPTVMDAALADAHARPLQQHRPDRAAGDRGGRATKLQGEIDGGRAGGRGGA